VSERLGHEADIALITFSSRELLDDYQTRRSVRVPILVDADRSVYRAYGLGRGSLGAVWGWTTIRRYIEILRSSGVRNALDAMRYPSDSAVSSREDTRQLGGDFVIAPDGTIALAYRSSGPADRPDLEALVTAVHRAAS